MEWVESMAFYAKKQAKEGGMQVLQLYYFIPQGYNVFSIWAINMMAMGKLELQYV